MRSGFCWLTPLPPAPQPLVEVDTESPQQPCLAGGMDRLSLAQVLCLHRPLGTRSTTGHTGRGLSELPRTESGGG